MPILFALLLLLPFSSQAQAQPAPGWEACQAIRDDPAGRLACFDAWARRQQPPPLAAQAAPDPVPPPPATRCQDTALPQLTRFWELAKVADCGLLDIRSYRPITVSLVTADSVNRQPSSDNALNSAVTSQPYRNTETRIQLSIRSKLAHGILLRDGNLRDSLWFGYTQQSYWQIFTPVVSRPFRTTDHEPEFIYVLPLATRTLGGWQARYAGLGLVHQSNGQSLPLSRSWNRLYLMAGAEHERGFTLQGRVWRRISEAPESDDNPGIGHFVGRAELSAGWATAKGHEVQLTWRNNLDDLRRGSLKGEWMLPVESFTARNFGRLRLHTQLFHGFGASLVDFNRRRTVLSLGVSLDDW